MSPPLRYLAALAVAWATLATAVAGPVDDGFDAYREKDYLKALEVWRPLANEGDRTAQYYLGMLHAEGKGVVPNDVEAARWFERAAEQGEPMAQYNLGASYAEGTGVDKDLAAAARWFRRAADQGVALAQLNLGILYANGLGVPKDNVEAMKWIDLAIYALPAGGIRSEAAKALADVAAAMSTDEIQDAKGRERAWKAKAEPVPPPKPVAKAAPAPAPKAGAVPAAAPGTK